MLQNRGRICTCFLYLCLSYKLFVITICRWTRLVWIRFLISTWQEKLKIISHNICAYEKFFWLSMAWFELKNHMIIIPPWDISITPFAVTIIAAIIFAVCAVKKVWTIWRAIRSHWFNGTIIIGTAGNIFCFLIFAVRMITSDCIVVRTCKKYKIYHQGNN